MFNVWRGSLHVVYLRLMSSGTGCEITSHFIQNYWKTDGKSPNEMTSFILDSVFPDSDYNFERTDTLVVVQQHFVEMWFRKAATLAAAARLN